MPSIAVTVFAGIFRMIWPPGRLNDWLPAIEQIEADGSIQEVILSGGDPLTLVDAFACAVGRSPGKIPHLRRLRLHTRLPIVIPQRVTASCWIG